MAAAARGKFVWLETLRSARKTRLVQDGKSRVLPRAKHFNELFVLEDWFKVKTDNEEISEPIRFDIRKQPSLRHL